MKKRKLFTMVLLWLMAAGVLAQNAVILYHYNGTTSSFAFSEKPVISYSGNDLVLTTKNTAVQYPVHMLRKIDFGNSFEESIVGIDEMKSVDTQFSFYDGKLTIQGDEPFSRVYIYTLKGMKVGEYQLDSQGNAFISTTSLSNNFYVVKTKRFTFKFRKS